ncbi:MAG: RNA 2',3'-cyclic phosphodiesterase [Candidatus Bathyarchaeia archaeon]
MLERIRSFIAFDLSDEKLLDRLVELQRTLLDTGADLKLVERENLHLTLRFLGELPPDVTQAVTAVVQTVTFKPFTIHFRGLGVFPNFHHINVVWVGVREGAEEMQALFNQIEPKLRKLGLRPDQKGFSPHLTIARVKTGKNRERLVEVVQSLSDCEVGEVSSGPLKLKMSTLTSKGPQYSTICQKEPNVQDD